MAKNNFDELIPIGVDIGKDTFHVVAFDPDGQLVLRKQIKVTVRSAGSDGHSYGAIMSIFDNGHLEAVYGWEEGSEEAVLVD